MSEPDASGQVGQPSPPAKPSNDLRKRTPFEAEALVAFAAAIGVGVFAAPFDLSKPIRYLIAVIGFVLVLVVFSRYPQLSRWLAKMAISAGFSLLAVLIVTLIVLLATPSLRPSVGAV